jgi:hypothetical protein
VSRYAEFLVRLSSTVPLLSMCSIRALAATRKSLEEATILRSTPFPQTRCPRRDERLPGTLEITHPADHGSRIAGRLTDRRLGLSSPQPSTMPSRRWLKRGSYLAVTGVLGFDAVCFIWTIPNGKAHCICREYGCWKRRRKHQPCKVRVLRRAGVLCSPRPLATEVGRMCACEM